MFSAGILSKRRIAIPAPGSNTLLSGLCMYLALDETSGDVAQDQSPRGHDANAVSASIAGGLLGNSRDLAGSGKLTLSGDSSDFDSPAYSVALWVQMNPDGNERGIMCHEGSFAAFGWRLALSISTTGILSLVHNSVGECSTASPVDLTGSWHRIFVTYSGAVASLYLDGALVATADLSPRITAVGSGELMNIGCLSPASFFQFGNFPGKIDEVGYWNCEVPYSDVVADWNDGLGLSFSNFSM